ncbi:alanine racemase [Hyphomicrobium sp. CS1GBMeth3]|uniref:alanine racemase n=1 Tax=Hyphomicrobium sp. CS1GBMeth3 TaxID=1892845 RepID=UPI00093135E7|nr:alanine racemase [Hyphomicrobium sp. CS1GBMeth3]
MDGGFGGQFDSDTAAGLLTVDLAALRENYRALAARLAPVRAAAVVKADGYGLGASRVAPAVFDAGCRDFFVAHFHEALPLKAVLPIEARLFVLNGLHPGAEARCAAAGIIPVLNSLEQLQAWSSCAETFGRELPAVLQFDTGMSRLGLSETDAQALATEPTLLRGIHLLFVMSHLASADDPDNPQNREQLAELHRFAARFPGIGLCLSNSGGIFLDTDFHGALARPGIALYGGAPTANSPSPMRPVVRLDVRVIQTRNVPAEARVGYSGTYVAKAGTRLATIAAGYADGLPHALSNRGAAYFDGTRLPIVGRVSMDTITLDASALPTGAMKPGSLVEIIGPNQSLERIATDAGTISYEILTRLGRRYHRQYC